MQATSLAQASSGLAGLVCERVAQGAGRGEGAAGGMGRGGGQSKCVAHAMQGLEKEVGTLTELRQDIHILLCSYFWLMLSITREQK